MSLISDAGTPTLSDPGLILVKECIKKNINIFPIPGPSSITATMSLSGYEDKFLFYGFLPKTENQIIKTLNNIKNLDFALVFFIPGIKINFYIKFFKEFFSGRDIFIAREITKIHETFYRNSIDSIDIFKNSLKGELTVVISKKYNNNESLKDIEIKNQAIKYVREAGNDLSESQKEKISKKIVYEI